MNFKPKTSIKAAHDTKKKKEVKEDNDKRSEDYVTIAIGAFGLWQLIYVLIASAPRIITTLNTTAVVFLTPETGFICKQFSENITVEAKKNTCYDSCIEYDYTNDIFEHTMISDFGMICENDWLQSFAQTIMMLGVLCGVSLFGWFSDRFGRRKAMVASGITCAIFMLATPFCPSIWTVSACRFITGLGTGGYLTLTPVYLSEVVGIKLVDITVCTALLPFDGAGLAIQAAIAYFTSTWKIFMIVCSSMTVLIVCTNFFMPETPRWLVAKGKDTEAIELMTRAAKLNNRDTTNIRETVQKATEQVNLKKNKDINLTYLELFRTKKLAIWTVASVWLWFVTGFSYFGLLQHISYFGFNLYIVNIVLGVVQIIVTPLSVLVVQFCGRKVSSIWIYTIIGVLSLAMVFIPKQSNAAVILGAIGATVANVSYSVVYIIVIELYPTPIRNMGLSVSSIGSMVAAMVAPFVVNIRTRWVASSVFAAVGFSAIIFCFLLPETKGKQLKDSIDEVEQ